MDELQIPNNCGKAYIGVVYFTSHWSMVVFHKSKMESSALMK